MTLPSPSTSSVPRITVVVLTHNRVHEVTETVARLLALPERPPVIVADNGSTDATVETLRARFPSMRVVECGANLGAAGRNHAVAVAETDYVAFSDDDTWWEPGSLAHAVRVLDESPQVAVLNARVVVGENERADATCERMSASPLDSAGLPGPLLTGYMAGACVFRRAAFLEVGGYEPRLFIGGEEELVSLDLLARGHAMVYCDRLVVHHHPSPARDAGLRRRMLARNAAWVAWLRLPLPIALKATLKALRVLLHERALWRDAPRLVSGIAWACSRRRVVPPHVLAMRRAVRNAERTADWLASRNAAWLRTRRAAGGGASDASGVSDAPSTSGTSGTSSTSSTPSTPGAPSTSSHSGTSTAPHRRA
ncbi:glycosyltransferase [Paraburkholderia sp. SUR17]|uniref:glycosyltransferase family 2 protein n=1 Tax=Paraburkholderia sp. SUR17 TaxID=3034358 RepID=UPI0024079D4B|nr:glycosyltransferase [Paraburkholderia sp. SUR17]WEY41884.1 glycosyltransferase [Paraburkholderia sp. SUR17]